MTVTADQLATVLIQRSGSFVTSMQLQKLLYYAQAWHLAVTDEPLFDERIKAWADGPVVPQVWNIRKEPDTRVPQASAGAVVELDELTSDLIDLVLARYGSMSGDELSALTHAEMPWREARGDTPEGAPSREALSLQTMATFYRESRRLGGRTAADLAAGGVHPRSPDAGSLEPFDIDAFLSTCSGLPTDEDEFGGANLVATTERDAVEVHRTFMSA